MDESSSRFRIPKTFDEEKACVINPIPKSTGLQEQMGVADFWRMTRAKSKQDLHNWARRSVHSLDVQELAESSENRNAKSLNFLLCKFVQEVGNKSGERYPSRTL